ncbi:MAG: hypothetical protein KAY37_16185 [Phycisphaerae bacterium]|nr:hypothetical protein [Phycisphaerae bacterium]
MANVQFAHIRFAVVIYVLAAGFQPCLGGRFFGTEQQVAEDYEIGPAIGGQVNSAVIWGAGQYFAVWEDARDISFGLHALGFVSDIFGARVTSDANLLDPVGIPINRSPDFQMNPSLAYDGTQYLTVWALRKGLDEFPQHDVYFTLVTADGVPLVPDGVILCNADSVQDHPSVAWGGQDYFAVWNDQRDDAGDIYGARITTNGDVLDPNGFPLCQATATQTFPDVASSNTKYLIVWEDTRAGNSDVYGAFYDPDGLGVMPDFPICSIGGDQQEPVVTWDGSNFLVAWHDSRSGSRDIFAARVTTNGTVLDPDGFAVAVTIEHENHPALVTDEDGNSLLAYQLRLDWDSPDIHGVFVSSGGGVSQCFPICTNPGTEAKPRAAFNGSEYFVAWNDSRGDDIYATRVTAEGTIMDPGGFRLSNTAEYRQWSAVDFDGQQYLVAWTEYDADEYGGPGVFCARVDPDGTPIDTSGILVCDLPTWERFPQVASTPLGSMLIWQDERNFDAAGSDIYGAWVGLDGTVTPVSGNPVCTRTYNQERPAMCWDGGNKFLIVFEDWMGQGYYKDVWGLILHADGSPSIGPFVVCQADKAQIFPAAAFDGTNFMVVWEDQRQAVYPSNAQQDLFAARVTTDGVVLDPDGFPVVDDDFFEVAPRISFDGEQFLIVYNHVDDTTGWDVYGVWLDPASPIVDPPFQIAADLEIHEIGPDVAWDGLVHAVSFRRGSELCVARVDPSPAGGINAEPICLEPDYGLCRSVMAHGPNLRHLVVYQSWLVDPPYGTHRILARPFESRTKGDYNDDGDVNMDDFTFYPDCMTGPGPTELGEECHIFDFEPDGDVDLIDFASFQVAFTGE